MDKALVSISIPRIENSFDAFVPLDIPVFEVTEILVGGVKELARGKFEISGLEMIVTNSPRLLLNPLFTLRDYGVSDGSQLYLI